MVTAELGGEGYSLDIDEIVVAAAGAQSDPDENFVGHMRNFILNGYNFFEFLDPNEVRPSVIGSIENEAEVTDEQKPIPIRPVTYRAGESDMTAWSVTVSRLWPLPNISSSSKQTVICATQMSGTYNTLGARRRNTPGQNESVVHDFRSFLNSFHEICRQYFQNNSNNHDNREIIYSIS